MANEWLGSLLGLIGAGVGTIIAPGVGTGIGASLGGAAGGLLGNLFGGMDNPADAARAEDQRKRRMLADQIAGGNNDYLTAQQGTAGQEQLAAEFAGRGLGNSGVAGAAYGALNAGLLGQRAQFRQNAQTQAANILAGIGDTGPTNGQVSAGQFGQTTGQLLPLLELLGKNNAPGAATPAPVGPTAYKPPTGAYGSIDARRRF